MTSCDDPCMAVRGTEWRRSEVPGETGGSGDRISERKRERSNSDHK